jgi:predicted esterase
MTTAEHYIHVRKTARYYTIGTPQDTWDMWVVCHGYGQLAGTFIQQFACIATAGRLIVAPEALHRFYLDPPPAPAAQRRVGATWMTREDRLTDIADYIDYLDTLISELVAHSPSTQLRVLGFSQGSATVLRWAARATRVPDELILWAGEVPGDVDWHAAAPKLAHTRIHAVRGSRDQLTPQAGLDKNLATLTAAGLPHQLHEFNGGHRIDENLLRELATR